MPDYGSAFRDGQWSARHVYSGEPLPTLAELREERLDTLRAEWPDAAYGTLFDLAAAWAQGWLAVAERERKTWLASASVED